MRHHEKRLISRAHALSASAQDQKTTPFAAHSHAQDQQPQGAVAHRAHAVGPVYLGVDFFSARRRTPH
jgi:hypothetical protein